MYIYMFFCVKKSVNFLFPTQIHQKTRGWCDSWAAASQQRRWTAVSWPGSRVKSFKFASSGSWVKSSQLFFSTPQAPKPKHCRGSPNTTRPTAYWRRWRIKKCSFQPNCSASLWVFTTKWSSESTEDACDQSLGCRLLNLWHLTAETTLCWLITHCVCATRSLGYSFLHHFSAFPPKSQIKSDPGDGFEKKTKKRLARWGQRSGNSQPHTHSFT